MQIELSFRDMKSEHFGEGLERVDGGENPRIVGG
jgi:hypothetical protein